MVRRAGRVDTNHGAVRDAFIACGCLVQSLAGVGSGVPDLLVSRGGVIWLVEVKHGKGALTNQQVEWHAKGWPVWVVREVEDVPLIVRAMVEKSA